MSLRAVFASLAVIGATVLMVGCGGSSNGLPIATTPVHVSIAWAERSRAIQGPSSALSATITLTHASATSTDVSFTVDRNSAPVAYTQTYTSAVTARVGTAPFTIRFYDQAGGTGNVVAVGQSNVTITANGGGIGDVSTTNTVTRVAVTAGQTVPFGTTSQLGFSARAADNSIVAVSPGSAIWSQVDGSNVLTLTTDGMATAVDFGTSNVRVAVDGVTSASAAVTVPAPPDFQDPGFESASLATGAWFQNDDVVGTPWTGDKNWGIADAGGAWGTFPHTGSQYAFIQAANNNNPVSHGALHQTITGLTVGTHYRVSMWIARRNGNVGGNTGALVTMFANGAQILGQTSPNGNGSFSKVTSDTFTATQSSYAFTIQTVLPQFTEDQATLVDDVHLELAP